MSELLNISTSQITQASEGLRNVDPDNEKFKELCVSIRQRGILNPINVRRGDDGTYVLVDGLHRFTAACMVGLTEVPAQVLDTDEEQALEIQIEANLHRVETKPIEYTRQLQRIMLQHPERTIEDQARRLGKSVGWLRDRLSLNVFEGRAAELIEEGKLPLSNAYALAKIAKLNQGEVDEWLDRATTMPPEDFIPEALQREKALKEALRSGKSADKAEATGPAVKLRKLGDIKVEFNRARALQAQKPEDAYAAGYLAAFQFCLSQDQATVEAWKRQEAERAKAKAEKAAEKEAEKAAAAAAKAKLSLADLVHLPKKKEEATV